MGSLWLLGCCCHQSCQGVSDTEHGWCHWGWLWDQSRGSSSLQSKPFLQLLCSGGVTPAAPDAPWGALGRMRTRSHCPRGCLVGVGGSEVVPISRYNPKARFGCPRESFTPWVFAFKGSILYFTRMPSLCVLCLYLWGTEFIPEAL